MERYHMYKLGIAILFYAIFFRRPTLVHCTNVDDAIGNVNDTSRKISAREYFVYYQGVQGRPGVDFPVFSRIPRTSFSCKEVESGYYADLETDCQVFHICNEGAKVSFLCPNGTIFQQSDLICDWWFKVNCTNSPNLYEESAEQLRESLIRRKASRRVQHAGGTSFATRDQGEHQPNRAAHRTAKVDARKPSAGGRERARPNDRDRLADKGDDRRGRDRHVFAVEDARGAEETQIPQESASFVTDHGKRVTSNPYPNHRETYGDIRDPKTYYTSQPASQNAFNNGRPFVVSTPKVGVHATEKTTFKYSPTVPSVRKNNNYITPLPSATTTKKYMSTYGERIRLTNAYAQQSAHPIADGRKAKSKTSFTIGLNSAQGAVAIKTAKEPKSGKSKAAIKLHLSSDGPAKTVGVKQQPQVVVPKLKLSLDNEIPSVAPAPTNGFYVTKSTFRPGAYATSDFNAGSVTGAKNTYIPTTLGPATTTERAATATTLGIPKPKPFAPPSSTAASGARTTTTDDYHDAANYVPNYQISSASPFTNVPPTLPSTYDDGSYVGSTPDAFEAPPPLVEKKALPEHVGDMLQTLQEIANVRFAQKEHALERGRDDDINDQLEKGADGDKRPGLVVPPSVGPQTLHTLAVYFANALDSLVEESNSTDATNETRRAPQDQQEDALANSLLSPDTVNKYKELFAIMAHEEAAEEQDDDDDDEQDDLQREHSNNAVQSPRVRQLAKVFTQALSSYLDDPETFKRALHHVRPTEPPPLADAGVEKETPSAADDDELLNFSDADIKPEHPRLPTPAPPNPTWGYILAYNATSNHVDPSDEHLQAADSQSFVPGYNEIHSNRVGLPDNHWTSSPDVAQLWQSTLYVDPHQINQNFDATEALAPTSTEVAEEFDDETTRPPDVVEFDTERYVDYELRSLPKLSVNSTSVHGLLIDYMNSSERDADGRLRRILAKLNTTEDEFLSKMKQIENNPLTKRLVLLLVSECGNATDARTHAVRDILNLAHREAEAAQGQQRQQRQRYQHANDIPNVKRDGPPTNSALRKLVDPALKDDEQDSRAIQLLNSLYSIASKYGK